MRRNSTPQSRRMALPGLSALLCLLLTGVTALLTVQIGHTATNGVGCMRCQIDGCDLSAGQYTVPTNKFMPVLRCVDWDNVKPGHCAAINAYEYDIWEGTPGTSSNSYIGNCYKIFCPGAFPTRTSCANPLVLGRPGRPILPPPGHGKAAPRELLPGTCQEGGS